MKKFAFPLVLLLFFIGCAEDDSQNYDEQIQEFDTKEVRINIVLPENSGLNINDLTISSLFTDGAVLSNNNGQGDSSNNRSALDLFGSVEVFNNNAMELVYSTNSSGNIVLMSYINPVESDEFTIDSRTTAISLAMFHPWIMHLSAQARQQAFQAISQLPEFEAYHNLITQAINIGEIDPLATQSILQAIDNFQDSFLNRVEGEISPLTMIAENNNVNIVNAGSSMAYSLQLVDENEQPIGESYLVEGVNKEIISWSTVFGVFNGNFNLFQPTSVDFPIPEANQQYTLLADRWSSEAAWRNGAQIFGNILGVISTTVKDLFQTAQCAISVGEFFYNNTNTIIQAATAGAINGSEAMQLLLDFIINNRSSVVDIVNTCPGFSASADTAFSKVLAKFSIIGNLESGTLLIFNIADIAEYDDEINFCFQREEGEIVECEFDDDIAGVWNQFEESFFCIGSNGNEGPTETNSLAEDWIRFFEDGTVHIGNNPVYGPMEGVYTLNDNNLYFSGYRSTIFSNQSCLDGDGDPIGSYVIDQQHTLTFNGSYNSLNSSFEGILVGHIEEVFVSTNFGNSSCFTAPYTTCDFTIRIFRD